MVKRSITPAPAKPTTAPGSGQIPVASVTGDVVTVAEHGTSTSNGVATIQIVVNNLIGFTTRPVQEHSSRFASDIAKRQSVPVFHVNAEEPEAVVRIGEIAAEYRGMNDAALMDVAWSISPRVEDTAPDTIVLDLEGLASLFGSEEEIARVLMERVERIG